MIDSLLPNEVKVKITIDDIRLRSNLTTGKTSRFFEKYFSYTVPGFNQSNSGSLNDPPKGYIQELPRTYKSSEPITNTGIDKILLKRDYQNGSFVNAIREANLYSFAHDTPPGRKMYKKAKINLFKKINKSVLSHITFCSEDDDHKAAEFKEETIPLTCQSEKQNSETLLELIQAKFCN